MRQDEVNVYDLGDGLYVDQDGEIIGGEPDGAMARICATIADCQRQVEAYQAVIGAGKAAILRHQQDKKAVHGAWVANVRQNVNRRFKREDFAANLREWLRDGKATGADGIALALAAKDFDRGALPDDLAALVNQHIEEVPTKPFVLLSPVLRDAPVPLRVPKDREVAS